MGQSKSDAGEDAMVLEIGCGAYAPFARWCADAGVKQAALGFVESTEGMASMAMESALS